MAINKKLIHFEKRDNFDTRLANNEINDTSIVFIQDTGELWTHGLFFCTTATNLLEAPSLLTVGDTIAVQIGDKTSNYIVPPAALKGRTMYECITATTDTRGHWTGTIPGVTELYDGLVIHVRFTTAYYGNGEGYNTLNINNLGPKLVWYRYNTVNTSHISTNAEVTLTYRTTAGSYKVTSTTGELTKNTTYTDGWVADFAYYSDSNWLATAYYFRFKVHENGYLGRYMLVMKCPNGTITGLSTNTTTNGNSLTNKPMFTGPLLIDNVFYYKTTTAFAANAVLTSSTDNQICENYGAIDARYTFNCGTTLTANKPFFIVGNIGEDGYFHLDVTQPWALEYPTTEDNKIYIYVGYTYSTYQIWLDVNNTAYIYKNGKVQLYSQYASETEWANIIGKPSTFTPSTHTHPYTDLTGSTTTADLAIVSNGTANGWTLKTLGSNAFNSTSIPTVYLKTASIENKLKNSNIISANNILRITKQDNTTLDYEPTSLKFQDFVENDPEANLKINLNLAPYNSGGIWYTSLSSVILNMSNDPGVSAGECMLEVRPLGSTLYTIQIFTWKSGTTLGIWTRCLNSSSGWGTWYPQPLYSTASDSTNYYLTTISSDGKYLYKTSKTLNSFATSDHTHAWNSLTRTSTTAGQVIVSTNTANGWELKTLGSNAFDSTGYVKLSDTEQTIESTISSYSKGIVEFYRSSGDHIAFILFANKVNNAKRVLGSIGFYSGGVGKLQYRSPSAEYYDLVHGGNVSTYVQGSTITLSTTALTFLTVKTGLSGSLSSTTTTIKLPATDPYTSARTPTSHTHYATTYKDSRNDAMTPAVAAAVNGVAIDFKTKANGVNAGTGLYCGLVTFDPYSDVSGGYPLQMGFNSGLDASNTNLLYIRTVKDANTWNSWRTIITSLNIGSQSVNTATNATYAANVGSAGTLGTNYVAASKVIAACNWYDTVTGSDTDSVINRWDEIVNFVAGFEETPDLATYLANNYLAKTGNSTASPMTGTIYSKDVNALVINSTNNDLDIWRVMGNAGAWDSSYGFYLRYNGTGLGNNNSLSLWANNQAGNDIEVYQVKLDGILNFLTAPTINGTAISLSTHDHDDRYLKLIGGTLTGTLNLDSNTMGAVAHLTFNREWSYLLNKASGGKFAFLANNAAAGASANADLIIDDGIIYPGTSGHTALGTSTLKFSQLHLSGAANVGGALTAASSLYLTGLTEGTSDVTDDTELVTSYAGESGFANSTGAGQAYRRKASKLYNYIKAKTDNLYPSNEDSIEYIVGTLTASTNAWLGVTKDASLRVGKMIAYKLPYAGTGSAATLNLTLSSGGTTGAITLRRKNDNVTTHYSATEVIFMVYDGTYWQVNSYYDTDTTGYYHKRIYSNIKAGPNKIFPYTMIMLLPDGRWESIVTSSSTDTSKTRNTHGFLLGHVLLMYANATYNENGNVGTYNIFSAHSGLIDHRYSFNTASNTTYGTTGYKPVYIVGTIGNDGLFYLDETWWTQTLPIEENSKVYIYIGDAYDTYRLTFTEDKPIYVYRNGGIRLYSGTSDNVSWSNITNKPESFTPASHNHDSLYVTSVGVTDDTANHANQLRYVVNGTSTYFTVPYATSSGSASTAATASNLSKATLGYLYQSATTTTGSTGTVTATSGKIGVPIQFYGSLVNYALNNDLFYATVASNAITANTIYLGDAIKSKTFVETSAHVPTGASSGSSSSSGSGESITYTAGDGIKIAGTLISTNTWTGTESLFAELSNPSSYDLIYIIED